MKRGAIVSQHFQTFSEGMLHCPRHLEGRRGLESEECVEHVLSAVDSEFLPNYRKSVPETHDFGVEVSSAPLDITETFEATEHRLLNFLQHLLGAVSRDEPVEGKFSCQPIQTLFVSERRIGMMDHETPCCDLRAQQFEHRRPTNSRARKHP